jgi:hypothetical protein
MHLQRRQLVVEPADCIVPRREIAGLLEDSLAEPPRGGPRSMRNDDRIRAAMVGNIAESPHESRFRVCRLKGKWGHCAVKVSGQLLYHPKTVNRPLATTNETTTVCRMTDERREEGCLRVQSIAAKSIAPRATSFPFQRTTTGHFA